MTRTIEERIEELLDHLDGIPMQKNTLCRNMIRAAFHEPWLDAPDGPGWWWIKNDKTLTTTVVKPDQLACGYWLQGYQWQRVIGPSE